MKKRTWFITAFLLLFVTTFFVCASYSHPSESEIRREFSRRNPDTEIIKMDLVFDEVAIATYQIEFRKISSNEVSTKLFTLQQCINRDWKSDYRECGKE